MIAHYAVLKESVQSFSGYSAWRIAFDDCMSHVECDAVLDYLEKRHELVSIGGHRLFEVHDPDGYCICKECRDEGRARVDPKTGNTRKESA